MEPCPIQKQNNKLAIPLLAAVTSLLISIVVGATIALLRTHEIPEFYQQAFTITIALAGGLAAPSPLVPK